MAIILNIFSEHERFVRRYMPMHRDMYAMAFRLLRQAEEAEDIVQDVMLDLYERRDSLPPEAQQKAYVLTMVRNRCIDRLRAHEVSHTESLAPPNNEDDATTHEPSADSPEAQIEARDYLVKLLSLLPERSRQLVKLRLVDGLSFDEIAKITRISPVNARVILSRTLKDLKEGKLNKQL